LLEGFPEGFFDLDFQERQGQRTTSTAMLSRTETSSGGALCKRLESQKKTDCKEEKKDGHNTKFGKGAKEEKKGGGEGGSSSRGSGEGGSSSSRSSSTTTPASASAAALPPLKKEKARLERELRKLEREKKETSP
jgi:hypothetical protein